MTIRPLYIPAPYQDTADSGRLILQDGSTARIRRATRDDIARLRDFYQHLSLESLRKRSRSELKKNETESSANGSNEPDDSSDPSRQLILIVTRDEPDDEQILASGLYTRHDDDSAAVAFAVDKSHQRKGIGQLLLERLAIVAVAHGIRTFQTATRVESRPILDVFRHSGFVITESLSEGYVEIDFSVVPSSDTVRLSEVRDRTFTATSLEPFFRPRAVAIIGASRKADSIGSRILERLVSARFEGPVYPINPRARSIGAIPCYASLEAVPPPVDLAVIALPAKKVLAAIEECSRAGVKAVIVVSAGFAEIGEEGRALQDTLSEAVRGFGLRMIGPNCLGVINPHPEVRLNASFSPLFPRSGRVAMASQSGALGLAILDRARQIGLGISSFVSIGNKADVSGNDLLQYWEEDPHTDVILLYQESLGNPRRFSRIARRISRKKPILCVKGGRSSAGERAASSHTAALAGRRDAADAIYGQAGVLRVDTLSEMFHLAQTLANQPLPTSDRVAILTNAGGPAILCADMCEDSQLQVAPLATDLQQSLRSILPAAAAVANPVDMIASANEVQYEEASRLILTHPDVDALVVMHVPVHPRDREVISAAVGRGVLAARTLGATSKPVLFCAMGYEGEEHPIQADGETIPTYTDPEVPARVLGRVLGYSRWKHDAPGVFLDHDDIDPVGARHFLDGLPGGRWLTWDESRQLLEFFNILIVPGQLARTAEEAANSADRIGYPVAMKVQTKGLSHKSDRGGVVLGLNAPAEVREGYDRIMGNFASLGSEVIGVLVQPMIGSAVEVMVGAVEDRQFGALLTFGLGGIHVEILRDVAFRVTPLTDQDARGMITELRGRPLLEGYRGHPPADIPALENLLLRISRLLEEIPRIIELDLNPVMALSPGNGYAIVDVRIRISEATTKRP